MALQKVEVQNVLSKYQSGPEDTGSSEVQIALLTARIQQLTEHFKVHTADNHSRMGLQRLISRRTKLLRYLKQRKPDKYSNLIKSLELRK